MRFQHVEMLREMQYQPLKNQAKILASNRCSCEGDPKRRASSWSIQLGKEDEFINCHHESDGGLICGRSEGNVCSYLVS